MSTATLRAHGGSISITIPRQLLTALALEAGSKVNILTDGKRISIEPVRKPKYTLEQLVKAQKELPIDIDREWDKMPSTGKEAW